MKVVCKQSLKVMSQKVQWQVNSSKKYTPTQLTKVSPGPGGKVKVVGGLGK